MSFVDPYGLTGQVLDGQFQVETPIGEGGFSVVYRARHLGLGEPVAVKCLKLQPQLGSAIVESFVQRFRDESRIHYKLSQTTLAVARTVAAGTTMATTTGALVPYMVLEWLDGYTLAEELRARRQRGERGRTIAEAVALLDPVADAIAKAHGFGIVHRDLNPSNIFIARQPGGAFAPKVMDFGIAKVVSDQARELGFGPRAVTLSNIHMFTPSYGAPEQYDERIGAVGPWTDVYAFGLLFVELLTDRIPNDDGTLGELMARALNPASRPTPRTLGAEVGDHVEAVVASAVAVEPSERPADLGEFWGRLKNAITRDREAAPEPRRPSAAPMPSASSKTTDKGTHILYATRPSSAPAASSGEPPFVGPHGTIGMTQVSPDQAASGLRPADEPTRAGNARTAPTPLPAAGRPPEASIPRPVDPYGATSGGVEARPGASPLSTTVGPNDGKRLFASPDALSDAPTNKRPEPDVHSAPVFSDQATGLPYEASNPGAMANAPVIKTPYAGAAPYPSPASAPFSPHGPAPRAADAPLPYADVAPPYTHGHADPQAAAYAHGHLDAQAAYAPVPYAPQAQVQAPADDDDRSTPLGIWVMGGIVALLTLGTVIFAVVRYLL